MSFIIDRMYNGKPVVKKSANIRETNKHVLGYKYGQNVAHRKGKMLNARGTETPVQG